MAGRRKRATGDRNRERLRWLLAQHTITQADAAARVSRVTGDPMALRTLQAYLAEPDKPSSRPCPGWVVHALERSLGQGSTAAPEYGDRT